MAYESRLELSVDSRRAEGNLKRLDGQLARTERTGNSLVSSMGGITRAIGMASAAVGGFSLARVIRESASFEQAMLGVQAVSGATADQMQQLQQQARELGATSMFSAQQAAEAQQFLAMAGFSVNEVLEATPGILQLATAGNLDLARAADIASNVLGGMQLQVADLARVNDVLAATAAGSNTSIEQLGQALSFAAPFAASAGIEIEEAAAAIGTLSDSGLQASRAGTGLVGVIRQLSRVTPNARATLAEYGLTVDDVNIEAHGLTSVLDRLGAAGISTGDAFEIFGSEAGAAAQILANGSDRVEVFTGRLRDAEGAAQQAALTLGSGLTGSMRTFNSVISESILQVGDAGVAGSFKELIDTASGVISVYNGMLPQFIEANDLSEDQADSLQSLADILRVTGTVAGGAAAGIAAYRGALVAATLAQWAFNAAVTANPLGIIATAAGTAVGAMYLYREELGLVDAAAQNAADAIAASAGAIRAGSAAAMDASYDNLISSLEAVSLQAQEAMAQLVELEARQRFYERSHQGVADSVAGAVDEQAAALARLWGRQVELQRSIRENREARDQLNSAENEAAGIGDVVINVTRDMSGETERLTKAQREAIREAEQFAGAFRSLHDQLRPIEAAQRRYREELDLLNAAHGRAKELLDAKLITEEEYNSILRDRSFLLQELESRYRDSAQTPSSAYGGIGFGSQIGDPVGGMGAPGEDGYWDRWLSSAETALTDFDQLAANTAENFQRGFGNAFESMVFDSQSLGEAMHNLADGVARSMVSALGEMAAQWLAYQAVQMMVGRSTQSAAVSGAITNALAKQQEAQLNAYAATAAIPMVGPAMAPGAAAAALAATTPMVAAISSLASSSILGQAHGGWDSLPKTGTYNLEKGERVVSSSLNRDLTRYLERAERSETNGGSITIHAPVTVQAQPGMSNQDAQRQGSMMGKALRAEVLKIMQDQQRPGGVLAKR